MKMIAVAASKALFPESGLAAIRDQFGIDVRVVSAAALADQSADALVIHHQPPENDAGHSALSNIRARVPSVPVAVIVEPDSAALIPQLMEAGATDVWIRPEPFAQAMPYLFQKLLQQATGAHLCEALAAERDRLLRDRAAKKEFLSAITHELRTPLVAIKIYSQFFSGGRLGEMTPQQREKAQAILRNAERLADCIENIQRFERLDGGKIELVKTNVDLRALVGDAMGAISLACMDKGIALGQSWPATNFILHADRELLGEAIRNLLLHAVEVTPAKGSITIAVSKRGISEASVSITNNGPNMSKEDISELFAPTSLWTDQPSSGANGGRIRLGLAMVKRILELHGVEIEADSQEGKGTRFRFSLPISREELPHQTTYRSGSTRRIIKTVVLVVDDDEDNLACTRAVLEFAGFEVLTASSLERAEAELAEGRAHIVLLDIAIRGQNGFYFLQRMKGHPASRSTPVVMLSACADDSARAEAFRLGASGFVVKPFDPQKLQKALSVAMAASGSEPLSMSSLR